MKGQEQKLQLYGDLNHVKVLEPVGLWSSQANQSTEYRALGPSL